MVLSNAMDWWDEWKLRIFVLCSLFAQFILFISGYVRALHILRRLRVVVWLAYIGADALAVFALATLFNRQKQQALLEDGGGGGGNSSTLEVIWAPVLLIHLGGQIQITAYSLEDNELWKRYAITLVSQVMVALYVFCKWWSGETKLLHAAVLLFIFGILKFSQKPWALRRASYGSIASTYLSSPPQSAEQESSSRWRRLGKLCFAAVCTCTNCDDIVEQLEERPGGGVGEKGTNYSLEEYVKEAKKHVKEGPKESGKAQREKFIKLMKHALVPNKDIFKLFADLAAPYSVRLHYLQFFLTLDGENQHAVVSEWIDLQFRSIYTKLRSALTCLGICTFFLLPSLPLASVVIFAKSNKDGYDKSDITVTYILFIGTVGMELAPLFMGFLCEYLCQCNKRVLSLVSSFWPDMVSQHNIMSFCARNKKPPALMKLATISGYLLRYYINKHWYIRYQRAAQQICVLVRHHAEDGWKEYIRDAATYRRFNNFRGERTLWKMNHHLLDQDKLGWTFNRPFDEYVLLWHIATDLCLHHTSSTTTASSSRSQDTTESRRSSSEIISNYMIYLLFMCPDMLIPGTRSELFVLASDEIECMINESTLSSSPDKTRSGISQWIIGMEQGDQRMTKAPRKKISHAHQLARVLIDSLNEEQRWKVIQGVWMEMLCYSASRCRGYLHAKSLGVNSEFLTNVWLLWWSMGMQTLPDMMHNPGSPEEAELTAAASV